MIKKLIIILTVLISFVSCGRENNKKSFNIIYDEIMDEYYMNYTYEYFENTDQIKKLTVEETNLGMHTKIVRILKYKGSQLISFEKKYYDLIYDTEKNNFENKESLVFIIKIYPKSNQIEMQKVKKDLEYENKNIAPIVLKERNYLIDEWMIEIKKVEKDRANYAKNSEELCFSKKIYKNCSLILSNDKKVIGIQ